MTPAPACKEVSRLLSEAMDLGLREAEARLLRDHTTICQACRNCQEQFRLLREAMSLFRRP